MALADDAPESLPRGYVEVGLGGGSLSRDPGGDFGPSSADDFVAVGSRGGWFVTPTSPLAIEASLQYSHVSTLHPGEAGAFDTESATASRQRFLVGIRVAKRRGKLGVWGHLGVGLERAAFSTLTFDGTRDSGSGSGKAFELGAGVAYRFGERFHAGLDASLGLAAHDGDTVGEDFYLGYDGLDNQLLVIGGASF